jgi:UDP-GlcNAc:undecaprenyl-phosphate GlcNAc-1-phosphate transferase
MIFMESYIIVSISILAGLLATYGTRRFAIKNNIGTVPNQRKIHVGFIPHMGGVGIYLGGLFGLLVALIWKDYYWHMFTFKYAGILTGATIMLVTGIVDDTRGLQAGQKFFLQLIAATIVIYSGCKIETIINPFGDPIQLGIFSIPITYLWLIGITNALNLLDGLDGLASGVGLLALATFAILSYQQQDWMTFGICLAFIGGIIGFLYFNYHPASIFMGDTGSLFLGFLIAALAVKGLQKSEGNIALLVPIIALAVPIGDTSLAFFRRIYQGHHPFSPDRDHLHHRLLFLGLSHRQAVHIVYLFSFLFGLAAILMATETGLYGALIVLLIFMVAILSLYRLGYLEAQKIKTYIGEQTVIQVKKEMAPLSMRRFWHKFLLITSDVIMLNLALLLTYLIRFRSGLFDNISNLTLNFYFTSGIWLLLTSFFILLFALNGLYSMPWDISRFDKVIRISRVILFGTVVLFFITLDPEKIFSASRINIVVYAGFLILLVNLSRLFIIYIEKKLAVLEYGPHHTLLIGSDIKARKILEEIHQNPHLLFDVVGFVAKIKPKSLVDDLNYLGNYTQISAIIRDQGIEEVIIALDDQSPDEVLNIVAHGENLRVSFKVIPEMYDVISGLKTEEVIGHPLIKLFPEHMLPWQWLMKRIMDFVLAVAGLIVLIPLFLVVILIQMLAGIRPIFSIDDRVGKNGKIFGLVEFNRGEEGNKVGQLILTNRIYKLPQLLNVLMGTLSLVGPRAESKDTIENLRLRIRFYNRRFLIRPGMTGWAQLKMKQTVTDDMREEDFEQDLFYLENMSLIFDLRIIIRALIKLIVGLLR